jgi:4-hydroxybenzoate polyprenyltransferase
LKFSRLVVSSRPISWVNTAIPFAAAYYFSGGELGPAFWVMTLFFLIPYNFLMYGINDVFDYESDVINPRKGGVEGALLLPEMHKITLVASTSLALPFVLFGIWISIANALALTALLVSVLSVVAYSLKGLRFKEKPFLDSITSSIHFVSPAVYGLALAQPDADGSIWLGMTAFFLWGAASHAFGAVQDVRADRAAGISSIATALGARQTTRLAFVLYLVASVVLLLLPDRFAFAALAAVPYLFVTAREWQISDDNCERANRGWRLFLGLNFLAGAIVMALLIGPS